MITKNLSHSYWPSSSPTSSSESLNDSSVEFCLTTNVFELLRGRDDDPAVLETGSFALSDEKLESSPAALFSLCVLPYA